MLVRHKRLTATQLSSYTGQEGQLVVNKDHNTLTVMDGVKKGGYAVGDKILLQGPTELLVGVANVFTIVNYDSFSQYSATISRGTVELVDNQLIVEISTVGGLVELLLFKNGSLDRVLSLPTEYGNGPGPQTLIAGNSTAGFYGEVDPTELITYDGLASLIGLTAGTSVNNDESKWLKFSLDGSILYVMMKTGRRSVSWNSINARNAVYGGLEVGIRGYNFKCRLLKGLNSDPSDATSNTFNPPESIGSEWNRLMYPIHSGTHTHASNPFLPIFGTWATYSDNDLRLYAQGGNPNACQESSSVNTSLRFSRGQYGVTSASSAVAITATEWRACLELIP